MSRQSGALSRTRFRCYVYDGTTERGPIYNGVKYGKAIAFKEFAQRDAALRWLNSPMRRLLPRVMSRQELDPMSGMYMSHGGGQWPSNVIANLD